MYISPFNLQKPKATVNSLEKQRQKENISQQANIKRPLHIFQNPKLRQQGW